MKTVTVGIIGAGRIGIDHRRRRSKQGKDNAGKHDNRSLQTYRRIRFDKALSDVL